MDDLYLRFKDTNRLKIKGWKRYNHADSNHKSWSGYTDIRIKMAFMQENVTTNRHFIMIKVSIHQEDITIVNTYAPTNRTLYPANSRIHIQVHMEYSLGQTVF